MQKRSLTGNDDCRGSPDNATALNALGYTLALGDWQRKGDHYGNNWKKKLKAILSSDRLHRRVFLMQLFGTLIRKLDIDFRELIVPDRRRNTRRLRHITPVGPGLRYEKVVTQPR